MKHMFRSTAWRLPSLFFLFSLSISAASAQGLCPIKSVTVSNVYGRVFERGSQLAPIPATLVELKDVLDDSKLIGSVTTDEEGRFRFPDQQPGMYRVVVHLQVEGKDVMPSYDFIARIKRSKKALTKELAIVLDADCSKSEVRLVDKLGRNLRKDE